jgi:hypothetical protein
VAGVRTVFNRLLEEAENAPNTADEEVIHVVSADIAEVTATEQTRRDQEVPARLPDMADAHPARGRGTWVPKAAMVWPTRRPPLPSSIPSLPSPVELPEVEAALVPPDPLAPKPTVRLDGYSGSRSDGPALRRTSEERKKARRAVVPTTRMRPVAARRRPAEPDAQVGKARRLFTNAVEQWRDGKVFDARADALLARVFDPGNQTYARTVERWDRTIREALS